MEPQTLEQIMGALEDIAREIEAYFYALSPQLFFAGTAERWSPAHHLQHLVQSINPLVMALVAPKLLIRVVGGSPGQQRSYAEVRGEYLAALANGVRASGAYVPRLGEASGEEGQAKVLQAFSHANQRLLAVLDRWSEATLDAYALPHPVLGKLSAREMLFFTLYHNRHHLEGVRKLGQAAVSD